MKKIISLILILTMAISLAACSGNSPEASKNIEGELSDIMNKITENADVDSDTKNYILSKLAYTDLTAENTEYYLGKADYKYTAGYAAEPMVNAQAFSLVLLRTDSAAEAKTLAEEIKKTVNPNKWICVGVEETDVKTVSAGNLTLLVMAENSDKYVEAFEALAK